MNDATTASLFPHDRRGKTKVVDSAFPRAGGVFEVGAGTSAAADQQGGEGLVGGLAPGCETCRVEGCWCTAACREFSNFGREL